MVLGWRHHKMQQLPSTIFQQDLPFSWMLLVTVKVSKVRETPWISKFFGTRNYVPHSRRGGVDHQMKHKKLIVYCRHRSTLIFYEYLSKGFITTLMVHLVSDVWTFPILLLHDFSPVITVFRDLPLIQELCFLQSRLCVSHLLLQSLVWFLCSV